MINKDDLVTCEYCGNPTVRVILGICPECDRLRDIVLREHKVIRRILISANLGSMESRLDVLGSALKRERVRQGMTLHQVAEAAGLARSSISRFEANDLGSTVSNIHKVCQVLGVVPEVGLFREEKNDHAG